MKAQSVTERLLFRAPGLRSWVWEELGLPLWLEVGTPWCWVSGPACAI